jgi:hypothetical protein
VVEKIKIIYPSISDEEAEAFLKSLEVYCELIIYEDADSTLKENS